MLELIGLLSKLISVEFHRFARDYDLLDLRSAFKNPKEADITVEPFHGIFAHISGTPVNLDCPIRNTAYHLG